MGKRGKFGLNAWEVLESRVVLGRVCAPQVEPLVGCRVAATSAQIQQLRHQPASRTVGALGDSYSDEYQFYPVDRSKARNWVEILATMGRVNFGTFTKTSRGEPRNQGYAFNWARSDSTTSDLVRNQLPGLAAQVARGQIAYAWIFTGGNDFLFFLRGAQSATATPLSELLRSLAQIETQAEANFSAVVDVLLAASPKVRLVVATVPDVAALPIVAEAATDARTKAIVDATSAAIEQYDDHIRKVVASLNRIALADLAAESKSVFSLGFQSIPFGGTTIDLTTPSDDYHHLFLADGIHIGTVAQGLIANAFLTAVDKTFGARIPLLGDRQIVAFARSVKNWIHFRVK